EVGQDLGVVGHAGAEVLAAEGEDARAATGPGAGDEVGEAVAVHVAAGNECAVPQRRLEHEDVVEESRWAAAVGDGLAVEDGDAWSAAESGGHGHVGSAVAVEVANADPAAAAEARIVDAEEAGNGLEVAAADDD